MKVGVSFMFKQFFNGAMDKYKQMQEEDSRYQILLNKVFTLPKFYSFSPINKKELTVSYKPLMAMCADLNESDAVRVRGVIPIDEVAFICLYATECKTGLKFYFVATTKYLWLINVSGFLKYRYQDLNGEVIKNGLMSKVLLISNMLFNVSGVSDNILSFVKLLQDIDYREEEIRKNLDMFCGISPVVFYLNDISSGISVGRNHEIVFHTRNNHYKCNICDIKNYELLLDDMVVREKKSNRRSRLTANKNSCYEMVLRVSVNDRILLVPILEKSTFTSLYSSTSVEFMENKAFADKLVNLLDSMDEDMLNGEL